jgi:hypothetical protein
MRKKNGKKEWEKEYILSISQYILFTWDKAWPFSLLGLVYSFHDD